MRKVVGLGAGGHAGVVIEALGRQDDLEIVGLLDANPALWESKVFGVSVIGGDEHLDDLIASGASHFFVGVGMVKDSRRRRRLFELALSRGLTPLSTVHRTAYVATSATLGRGVAVLAGAIVNTHARIGDNVILNSGSIVEHDCEVGNHAHIATGAKLSGHVSVGHDAHVGIGAVVRQRVRIGDAAVVGAGAVVLDDVPPGTTVVGVPARAIGVGSRVG